MEEVKVETNISELNAEPFNLKLMRISAIRLFGSSNTDKTDEQEYYEKSNTINLLCN